MDNDTLLVRHKTNHKDADPITTPIYQASAFRSGDPFFYTRKNNPNFSEVEEVLKILDGTSHAILYSSGMAAIFASLSLLKPGDTLVVNELIYGCSYRLFIDYCSHNNISVIFSDLSEKSTIYDVINSTTNMVLFETPTNPFLKTIDIKEVSTHLHRCNPSGIIVVDNTWATPLFQNPPNLGADITIYSGSKFLSGHSDIIIGAALTNDDDIHKRLFEHRFYGGAVPDAFSAWLLRRSLQTLGIRMERHQQSLQTITAYLQSHSAITKVYLPKIDELQLRGYGGLLFIQLDVPDYDAVKLFMNNLEFFDLSTAMASVTSAVACPYYGSHLSMTAEEKKTIGLNEYLVRLSIGLENTDDLIADIDHALELATASSLSVI